MKSSLATSCRLPEQQRNEIVKSMNEAMDTVLSNDSPIDWSETLKENESWLRTIIAARVGEAAAVEEVFQEVSLAAIRQKAPIQDKTKVSPWLYRLAVTQSLLYRRTMGRKRNLINRYTEKVPLVEYDQKQVDPLNWLMYEERNQLVKKVIEQLPKKQKELLFLKYVHDWSYKEMAEKLGISISAIQSQLHRARALLRDKLNQMMPEETWEVGVLS